MIPRRDPETVPEQFGVQVLRRRRSDQYGTERGRPDSCPPRPIVTRNGVPVRFYRYRGLGESMSETEAEWWLLTSISARGASIFGQTGALWRQRKSFS